ncbi:MAG TPA: VWA domain-containing protein [Candidatus Limnocylindrales bacterium]
MSFIWPQMLVAVALVPLGILLYRALEGRRRRALVGGGLGLGAATVRRPLGVRARIPAVLFVAGFLVLTVGLARPQASVDLPRQEGTVILAFDVSGSMAADDLKPTRMEAAKAATQDFVQRQPAGVIVGVVAFSDAGLSVQAPTSDQATVLAAIKRLAPQRGTSLGQGIRASLNTIAIAENGPATDYYTNRSPAPSATPAPVAPGSHTSAVIVLLTDGENTAPPDPLAAAQAAADQGVRIYTVGIGSAAGTTLTINGFKVHTQLDATTLQRISDITGGAYYAAEDEQGLAKVYDDLDTRLVVKPQMIEVTALFAGASVLLLVVGGVCSLAWLGRLP